MKYTLVVYRPSSIISKQDSICYVNSNVEETILFDNLEYWFRQDIEKQNHIYWIISENQTIYFSKLTDCRYYVLSIVGKKIIGLYEKLLEKQVVRNEEKEIRWQKYLELKKEFEIEQILLNRTDIVK